VTNDHEILMAEGVSLIHQMASALREWLAVPPLIIQSAAPKLAQRRPSQQLLVQSARKLCEDIGAAVSLLDQGWAGPSHVLVRVCRENIVLMLYVAMAPQDEQIRFTKYIAEQKPAAARAKLHHLAKSILKEQGRRMPALARARWEGAILDQKEFERDDARAKQDPKAPPDYSFNRLVSRVAEFMRHYDEEEAGSFLTTVIDYWIESEVTHSGVDAIDAYHVREGPHQERIIDVLVLLMDLRVIAALSGTALLTGFERNGTLPLPAAIQALQQVTESVEMYFSRFPPSPPGPA
jgi:hypothetical protein